MRKFFANKTSISKGGSTSKAGDPPHADGVYPSVYGEHSYPYRSQSDGAPGFLAEDLYPEAAVPLYPPVQPPTSSAFATSPAQNNGSYFSQHYQAPPAHAQSAPPKAAPFSVPQQRKSVPKQTATVAPEWVTPEQDKFKASRAEQAREPADNIRTRRSSRDERDTVPPAAMKTESTPLSSSKSEPIPPLSSRKSTDDKPPPNGLHVRQDSLKGRVPVQERATPKSSPKEPKPAPDIKHECDHCGSKLGPKGEPLHDEWDDIMMYAGAVFFCGWVKKLGKRAGGPTLPKQPGPRKGAAGEGQGSRHGEEEQQNQRGKHEQRDRRSSQKGDEATQNQPTREPRPPRKSINLIPEIQVAEKEEVLYRLMPLLYKKWQAGETFEPEKRTSKDPPPRAPSWPADADPFDDPTSFGSPFSTQAPETEHKKAFATETPYNAQQPERKGKKDSATAASFTPQPPESEQKKAAATEAKPSEHKESTPSTSDTKESPTDSDGKKPRSARTTFVGQSRRTSTTDPELEKGPSVSEPFNEDQNRTVKEDPVLKSEFEELLRQFGPELHSGRSEKAAPAAATTAAPKPKEEPPGPIPQASEPELPPKPQPKVPPIQTPNPTDNKPSPPPRPSPYTSPTSQPTEFDVDELLRAFGSALPPDPRKSQPSEPRAKPSEAREPSRAAPRPPPPPPPATDPGMEELMKGFSEGARRASEGTGRSDGTQTRASDGTRGGQAAAAAAAAPQFGTPKGTPVDGTRGRQAAAPQFGTPKGTPTATPRPSNGGEVPSSSGRTGGAPGGPGVVPPGAVDVDELLRKFPEAAPQNAEKQKRRAPPPPPPQPSAPPKGNYTDPFGDSGSPFKAKAAPSSSSNASSSSNSYTANSARRSSGGLNEESAQFFGMGSRTPSPPPPAESVPKTMGPSITEDQLVAYIQAWAAGKESNLRALLATLQFVLWKECRWRQVDVAALVEGSAVKKAYQRAILCVHPDKVHGDTPEHKLIAKHVFNYLKEAYNRFQSTELF